MTLLTKRRWLALTAFGGALVVLSGQFVLIGRF